MLKILYTLFIGVLFAILVGVGIAAFYETPQEPEYPSALKIPRPEERLAEPVFLELKAKQENYDRDFGVYREKMKTYNRNVSIIAVLSSVITLLVSLTFFRSLLLIADGLLLGGVGTLLYSIGRGFDSGNDKFRFIIVAVSFTIALILGYIKLNKRAVR